MAGSGWTWRSSVLAALALCITPFLPACRESSLAAPVGEPIVDLLAGDSFETVAETRQFLFGAGDRSHLLEGWSVNEHDPEGRTFVWAKALDASVSLQVLQVQDLQLLVELAAFAPATPQEVTLLVNGREVSRFTAEPIFLEYRFVLPATALRLGENRLTFRHSSVVRSPRRRDRRYLAAQYRSILLGPQCLPLRAFGPPPLPRVEHPPPVPSSQSSMVITGPVLLRRPLEIPPGGVLRYHVSLSNSAHSPAIAVSSILENGERRELAKTRLAPHLFDRHASRDVEVDLSPWSGRSVTLELEIEPEVCRTTVATVMLDRLGVYRAGDAPLPSSVDGVTSAN